MKIKEYIFKNKYVFIIFFFFMVMWPLFGRYGIDEDSHYLCLFYADFNIGFCSRTFLGEFARLVTGDNITFGFVSFLVNANLLLSIILMSVILGKIVQHNETNTSVAVLCVAIVFAACSIRYFVSVSWTLCLDMFWVSCALVSILCLRNRWLKWLTPFICFFATGIHYIYLFTYAPFIVIFIIYDIYENRENRKSNAALLCTNLVSAFGSFLYFVMKTNSGMKMTMEQAHEYIIGRMPAGVIPDFEILDGYFYATVFGNVIETDGTIIGLIKASYSGTAGVYGIGLGLDAKTSLSVLPFVIAFSAFWVFVFVRCKEKSFRFVMFLTLLLPVCAFVASTASSDKFRFFSVALILNIACLLYLIYQKNRFILDALETVRKQIRRLGIFPPALLCAVLIYIGIIEACKPHYSLEFLALCVAYMLIRIGKNWIAGVLCIVISVADASFGINFVPALLLCSVIDAVNADLGQINTRHSKRTRKETDIRTNRLFYSNIFLLNIVVSVIYCCFISKSYKLSFMTFVRPEKVLQAVVAALALSAMAVATGVLFNKSGAKSKANTVAIIIAGICGVAAVLVETVASGEYLTNKWSAAIICITPLLFSLNMPYKRLSTLRKTVTDLYESKPFMLCAIPVFVQTLVSAINFDPII